MGMFSFFSRNKAKMESADEFSSDMTFENSTNLTEPNSSYFNSGVHMTIFGGNGKLTYEGLLSNSGADGVYAVVSYGNNQNWDNAEYYPMSKTRAQSFEVQFPITKWGNINVAFKDSANNWDNNNGMNYTFSNSER